MTGSIVAQPEVTIAIVNDNQTVQPGSQRVLAVGQKTAAGTAAVGLVQNVGDDFDALFGPSSMLAGMIRAYKRLNEVVQIDAIVIDDAGGGVPRVIDFTVAGTATAAGTITVDAGSRALHRFEVAIAIGDDETAIAAAIVAAINGDTACPFTAGNVAGAVTLTADNDGTVANGLGVEVIVDAAGISVASVTETTPGATDPTLTGVLDPATDRYQTIIWPYAATAVVAAYLAPRFNPANAIEDGVAIVPLVDTFANLESAAAALNDPSLVLLVDEATTETLYLGPARNEAPYIVAAYFAAARARRLSAGQSISDLVATSASLDQRGGPAIASLPYFNTRLTPLPLVPTGRGFTRVEIEDLLTAGASIIGDNPGKTEAIVGEVVTTYKTDSGSNPDPTFGFLNYVDTASQIREYYSANLRARFVQSRATSGAATRNRSMSNEEVINAYLDKLYDDLAGPDFVLVVDSDDARRFFKQNRVTTLDLATGTATITMRVPIVTGLRKIDATIRVSFSVAA